MSIFDELSIGGHRGRSARPTGLRAEAEGYAAALGLRPGGPGWGDAIRDYVRNGGGLGGEGRVERMPMAVASSQRTSSAQRFPDDDGAGESARYFDPAEVEQGGDYFLDSGGPGAGLTVQADRLQLAQPRSVAPGPFRTPERSGPNLRFREDDPKYLDLFGLSPSYPPLVRPLARKGRPTSDKPNFQKRRLGAGPGDRDAATWANRIMDRQRALPVEREKISAEYKIPLTSSPTIDRLYATMLAKERGLAADGTQIVNRKGMVGAAQMYPPTARDARRYSRIPYREDRLYNDRDYNEMLGLDYYKWLVERYDGDYIKAAAAYNLGLGRFRRVLSAAAQAGKPDEWEKYLSTEDPSGETLDYVTFFKKFNRIPDVRVPPSDTPPRGA